MCYGVCCTGYVSCDVVCLGLGWVVSHGKGRARWAVDSLTAIVVRRKGDCLVLLLLVGTDCYFYYSHIAAYLAVMSW